LKKWAGDMVKKIKQITKTQFHLGIVVIILLFIGLLCFSIINNRFRVKEDSTFVKNALTSPKHPLSYKTEFCASKLTDLAYEIHFLEKDISEQEQLIEKDGSLLKDERAVIEIEQREMSAVRKEFDEYRILCRQFDESPTPELCGQFLEEAKHYLDLAQENAKAEESKGIIELSLLSFHDLGKSKRIYEGIQTKCIGVE
jgi:hypothetical protein